MNLDYLRQLHQQALPLTSKEFEEIENIRIFTVEAFRVLELNIDVVTSIKFPISTVPSTNFRDVKNTLLSLLEFNIKLLEFRSKEERLNEQREAEIRSLKEQIKESQEVLKKALLDVEKLAITMRRLIV